GGSRQPGRRGQRLRRVSRDGQLCQQIFDRDQPGDVGAYRLAELARGPKDALVALRAPSLEHRGQVAVERTAAQGDLDHAADPGRVKRDLLPSWVASSDGRWRMDVSIPEPAEPEDLFGRRFTDGPPRSHAEGSNFVGISNGRLPLRVYRRRNLPRP